MSYDMNLEKKKQKAVKAINFLNCHPALNPELLGNSVCDGFMFSMDECCANGEPKINSRKVNVYKGDKGWEKYKRIFEKEFKDYPDENFQQISIPYEEKYGKKWEFDHVTYWYDVTFYVYDGNPYSRKEVKDFKKWQSYEGVRGKGNSFEDIVIDCARKAKKLFGNFNCYNSFLTEEEKTNHKNNDCFLFKEIPDDPGCREMLPNSKYADITNGLTNLRWLNWFIKTNEAKKNWNWEIKKWEGFINKIETMQPLKRKKILGLTNEIKKT